MRAARGATLLVLWGCGGESFRRPTTDDGVAESGASGRSTSSAGGGASGSSQGSSGGTTFAGERALIPNYPCGVMATAGEWCRELYIGDGSNFVVALNSEGDLLLAGDETTDTAGHPGSDVFLAKYTQSGQLEWVGRFGTEMPDLTADIAIDADDNVFVAGSSADDEFEASGPFVAKLSTNGELLWFRQSSTGKKIRSAGVAVDASGNAVTVTQSGHVFKYSPSGELVWTDPPQDDSEGGDVVVDAAGNIFVLRTALPGAPAANSGATLAALSPDSVGLWSRDLGGELPYQMALDRSGELVLLGYDDEYNPALSRYSATGDELWTLRLDENLDTVHDVSLDGAGNSFIVGTAKDRDSQEMLSDSYVVEYDPSGRRLWGKPLGLRGPDLQRHLVASVDGNVFVTGSLTVAGMGAAFLVRVSMP